MFSKTFVHLRVHTTYSLLEGTITVDDLAKFSKKVGMPAVAITDTGNLFGAAEFSRVLANEGVQPIIGCQLELISLGKGQGDRKKTQDRPYSYSLVLLVKDENGYQNLIQILNKSCRSSKPGKEVSTTINDLEECSKGLIALSGGPEGEIFHLLLEKRDKEAESLLDRFLYIFKDRFYLELTRFGSQKELQTEDLIIDLASRKSVPLLATNEAFFLNENMYEAHNVLLCISEGTYVSKYVGSRVTKCHRLKTPEEMFRIFGDLHETFENTAEIAKRCAFMIERSGPFFPRLFKNEKRSEPRRLSSIAREGLRCRIKNKAACESLTRLETDKLQEKYYERLEDELRTIRGTSYSGYYLIVADFVQWAREKRIPVGPGRGSGAGSLVAWSIFITDVDPIQWWLPFERFLNPERVSMPDFDIDFCQDRRDEVIRYVRDRYGADCVALISTFGKLQARAVVRDVGRSLGFPYSFINKICRFFPRHQAKITSLKSILQSSHELQALIAKDEEVRRLLLIASELEGLYRNVSTHAAGVVISDFPLEKYVPLYYDSKSCLQVTQFSMKDIEFVGLVKFDFLGLRTLTVIQHTIDQIRQRNEEPPYLAKIDLGEKKTFSLFQRAETIGVFQLESPGVRAVLRQLLPSSFEEIIALVALYRPGPMDHIQRYLACKNKHMAITYAHPALESVLKETFGVIVYQEQIMQIAQMVAGYSLREADLLRRAMGKKIPLEMEEQRENFVQGSIKNGIDQKIANSIFGQMAKFASYGFNKCHACPYALITYQTAYLKANYPVDFMASLMTHELSSPSGISLYYQELKRMSIQLLPPCINKSFSSFTVEETKDGSLAIRYALAAIKNVSGEIINFLVRERKINGPFITVSDFLQRLDQKIIDKRKLENLIASGALDVLHRNRSYLYESARTLLKLVRQCQMALTYHQLPLPLHSSDVIYQMRSCIEVDQDDQWTEQVRLQKEFESTGVYFSSHPLDQYKDKLDSIEITKSKEIFNHIFDHEVASFILTSGVVVGRKDINGDSGSYALITLSDTSGFYDVKLFPNIYEQYKDILTIGRCFLFRLTCHFDSRKNYLLNVLEATAL